MTLAAPQETACTFSLFSISFFSIDIHELVRIQQRSTEGKKTLPFDELPCRFQFSFYRETLKRELKGSGDAICRIGRFGRHSGSQIFGLPQHEFVVAQSECL